jgi:phage shock protein A
MNALLERVTRLVHADVREVAGRAADVGHALEQFTRDLENHRVQVKTQVAVAMAEVARAEAAGMPPEAWAERRWEVEQGKLALAHLQAKLVSARAQAQVLLAQQQTPGPVVNPRVEQLLAELASRAAGPR